MPKATHTYLKTHQLSGRALAFDLKSEEATLLEKARSAKSGRSAKTLIKDGPLRVTLIAMRKGTVLNEHEVEGPLTIQATTGRIRISMDGESFDVPARGMLTLEPGATHDATALTDAAFIITLAMQ